MVYGMHLYGDEEIEVCEFPKSMKYVQLYRVFCKVFDLGEKRERNSKYSKMVLLLKFEIKKMDIMFHIFMRIIKESIFQFR